MGNTKSMQLEIYKNQQNEKSLYSGS